MKNILDCSYIFFKFKVTKSLFTAGYAYKSITLQFRGGQGGGANEYSQKVNVWFVCSLVPVRLWIVVDLCSTLEIFKQ